MKRTTDTTEDPAVKRQKVEEANSAANGFNAAGDIDNANDLKRTKLTIPLLPKDAKILLLDIEGCTTSISFVKDVLFPFALSNLKTFMKDLDDKELGDIATSLKDDVKKLEPEHPSRKEIEASDNMEDLKEVISAHVKGMMANDVKATGLKALQGRIWKGGYASGELKAHVYEDFTPMLNWCKEKSISINIYSSGSIGAQKLLFKHTPDGDLCSFFTSHFDTTSGGKKEASSYKKIAKDLNVDPSEICFISDAEPELVAAREAGIGFPVMSIRPGNAPLTSVGREFPTIFSLLQICGSGK